MTIDEATNNINNAIAGLPGEVQKLLLQLGMDLRARVIKRISTTGIDKNGNRFQDYTEKYKKFKSGEQRIQASKKVLKSGKLSKGRKRPNRYQGFRDFNMTGSMLDAFNAFKGPEGYEIGFQNFSELQKAKGNSFGNGKWPGVRENIIEPSSEEINSEIIIMETKLAEYLKAFI